MHLTEARPTGGGGNHGVTVPPGEQLPAIWTSDELDKIGNADELEIVSARTAMVLNEGAVQ
jgi:hypothetical protein